MKLTVDQAVEYVKKSRHLSNKTGWRLGQSLFVSLPGPICDLHRSTKTDFYYWEDDKKVLECFYDNYVEK